MRRSLLVRFRLHGKWDKIKCSVACGACLQNSDSYMHLVLWVAVFPIGCIQVHISVNSFFMCGACMYSQELRVYSVKVTFVYLVFKKVCLHRIILLLFIRSMKIMFQ